jgi:hypothetical protein
MHVSMRVSAKMIFLSDTKILTFAYDKLEQLLNNHTILTAPFLTPHYNELERRPSNMPPNTEVAAELLRSDRPTPTNRSKVPSKLMDLSSPSESTLAISVRNVKESRLVGLPSEILGQILKEVMTGQTGHVFAEGERNYKTRICASPEDCPTAESPRVHLARDDNTVSDGKEDDSCFTVRHQECIHSAVTKSGLNLDVLRVCRQFYHEAALLPFQENKFVFGLHAPLKGPRPAMDGFMNRLNNEQRDAIRHVVIASDDLAIGKIKSQVARLRGLQSLHLLLAPGNNSSRFCDVLKGCRDFADTFPLHWLPLKAYRITMEAYLRKRDLHYLSSQAPKLDRLIRDCEVRFLSDNSRCAKVETDSSASINIDVWRAEMLSLH